MGGFQIILLPSYKNKMNVLLFIRLNYLDVTDDNMFDACVSGACIVVAIVVVVVLPSVLVMFC